MLGIILAWEGDVFDVTGVITHLEKLAACHQLLWGMLTNIRMENLYEFPFAYTRGWLNSQACGNTFILPYKLFFHLGYASIILYFRYSNLQQTIHLLAFCIKHEVTRCQSQERMARWPKTQKWGRNTILEKYSL